MFRRRLQILLLPLLVQVTATWGHDLWIERAADLHTLAYGHERSGHDGAGKLEYKADSVREALCFDSAGKETRADRTLAYPATLRGDCAASWFLVSSGYWSKTPRGTRNLPRTEAGPSLDSWLSIESVKRVDRWSAGLAKPLSPALELAPQTDPANLKAGDKLTVRAFFQGKPAADVTVAYFGKPRGITDADGRVNVRLANPGFQLLQASLTLPLADARADKVIHGTNLQFEIR